MPGKKVINHPSEYFLTILRLISSGTVYSETLYPRYHFGWSDLYSASDARFRFIRAPRPELYDLDKDPKEKDNLTAQRAQTVASMGAWLAKTMGGVTAPEAVDADTREKLAALGYVGAVGAGSLASSDDLPDPKDRIASYEDFKRGLALRKAGRDAEAVEQLRKVVAQNPLMTPLPSRRRSRDYGGGPERLPAARFRGRRYRARPAIPNTC
jgi:hypothetical protein